MMGEWYDVDRDLGGNAWVFKFNGSYVMAMVWMVVRGVKSNGFRWLEADAVVHMANSFKER